VQAGDNWFSIARRYGITQEALAAYNNSQPSGILQVGQVLRIPATGAAAGAPGDNGQTHKVQAGDNWFSIARRYGITQETLAAHNNSRPSDVLQVGQVLRVPAAGAAVSPPTPTPPRSTAVPAAATPTAPAATPTPVIPTVAALAAPALLSPMTGDGFTAGTLPVLTWSPVKGFGPEDCYYVLVRFTMRDGQQGYDDDCIDRTSYTVRNWVYDVAAPPDRLSVWSVQVRRMGPGNQEIELSPPSENRTFYWR
jgi:LysM repeat protein